MLLLADKARRAKRLCDASPWRNRIMPSTCSNLWFAKWTLIHDVISNAGLQKAVGNIPLSTILTRLKRSNWLWFYYFQYEVKAPVPSVCFRNICKQMAKMHEAIYDLLPEEQTQVSGIFEIHLTPPLQMRMNSVTRESSALSTGGGILFWVFVKPTHLKGSAAVTQTAWSQLKCSDVQGERWDTWRGPTDSSVLSCVLTSREVNLQFRN